MLMTTMRRLERANIASAKPEMRVGRRILRIRIDEPVRDDADQAALTKTCFLQILYLNPPFFEQLRETIFLCFFNEDSAANTCCYIIQNNIIIQPYSGAAYFS
jgi:hypothetical protein